MTLNCAGACKVNSMSIPHNVSSVMGAASSLHSSAAEILNDFVSICPILLSRVSICPVSNCPVSICP